MIDYRMRFYAHEDLDGNYHVQNAVAGLLGQHHVHSKAGFDLWKSQIEEEYLEMLDPAPCDCGLSPGDVRNHTGRIWHNKRFDKVRKIDWSLFEEEIEFMRWSCLPCGYNIYRLAGAPKRCPRCGKKLRLAQGRKRNAWVIKQRRRNEREELSHPHAG